MAHAQQIRPHQQVPIGKIKSFGPFGPKYDVGRPLRQLEDADWMVEIKMVESGETAEYRLTRILDDPEGIQCTP
jgi:hypothetical protein